MAKATGQRPKQTGKLTNRNNLGLLPNAGKASRPPSRGGGKSNKSGAYQGSPLVAQAPVDQGERSVGQLSTVITPKVYGGKGKAQVFKTRTVRKTRGGSSSGVQGAH
jgi:hypothetical protein